MKGYITKEQLSDSLKNELSEFSSQLENIENKLCININDFNAIADDDTFDNTAAFKSAIEYAKINNIKTILIPEGTYYVNPSSSNEINLDDNITIKGMSKNSIVKVVNGIGKWSTLFRMDSKKNVTFENFTIMGNSENSVYNYDSITEQVPIYASGSKNITINNMIIYGGGMWSICLFTGINNATISNNIIYFTHNNRPWEDVSTIYFEGEHVEVYNNKIYNKPLNEDDWIPETAIEIHGSYHNIYNNYVEYYKNGCIVIPNQLLDYNKPDSECVSIRYNSFMDVIVGVSIWTGSEGEHLRFLNVEKNIIRLKNKEAVSYGIEVKNYDNSITANSVTFIDSNIVDNIISFRERKISIDNREGDCGINLKCVTPMFGINISRNIINNSGGQGIYLHEVNYLHYSINDTKVINNTFNDVLYPIVLGYNLNNVEVRENIFNERTISENYTKEPISFYEAYPPSNKGSNIIIQDNKSISVNNTKLNLLEYDFSHASTCNSLPYPQYILKHNGYNNNYGYVSSNSRCGMTVPIGNFINLDGVNKKTFNTGVSTFGNLKDSKGSDVTITNWISNTCIEVTDTTFIEPGQLLGLEDGGGSIFRDYYIVVWYVKDNYIFTFNDANYNFTKTGSGDPVGKKIFYQSYSKTDLSGND